MEGNKINLFSLMADKFIKDYKNATVDEYGHIEWYGCNDRNACKTNLITEARQLRKLLLDIMQEIH